MKGVRKEMADNRYHGLLQIEKNGSYSKEVNGVVLEITNQADIKWGPECYDNEAAETVFGEVFEDGYWLRVEDTDVGYECDKDE